MNIQQMLDGKEMDQAVAKEVMEWEKYHHPLFGTSYSREGKHIKNWRDWLPSTKLEHAWEVVEWIAGWPGMWIEVGIDHDSMDERGAYFARLSDPCGPLVGVTGEPIYVRAKTMPLAVCKAALLLMEHVTQRRKELAQGKKS